MNRAKGCVCVDRNLTPLSLFIWTETTTEINLLAFAFFNSRKITLPLLQVFFLYVISEVFGNTHVDLTYYFSNRELH